MLIAIYRLDGRGADALIMLQLQYLGDLSPIS